MSEGSKDTLNWPYRMTGRRVDFTEGLPLAWGIEIDLPFDAQMREQIAKNVKIKIPERVTKLKFLTLNPQESLPYGLRNIDSDLPDTQMSSLEKLAETSKSRDALTIKREEIEDSFTVIFHGNDDQISEFNSILAKGKGDTLVIIEGHSWEAPWSLGEQIRGQPYEGTPDSLSQAHGNSVPIEKILKRYNKPSIYAAVVINACYSGEQKIRTNRVPIAYGIGEVGYEEAMEGLVQAVVVAPGLK